MILSLSKKYKTNTGKIVQPLSVSGNTVIVIGKDKIPFYVKLNSLSELKEEKVKEMIISSSLNNDVIFKEEEIDNELFEEEDVINELFEENTIEEVVNRVEPKVQIKENNLEDILNLQDNDYI